MERPTLPASCRRVGGRSLAVLAVVAVLSACSTSGAPASETPAPGGSAASASNGAAASGPSTAAATSPTPASVPSVAGPKAKTCRDLLSDSEVREATGLANAALKSVDVTVAIVNETHCTFDAGTTTIDVSVWSGDRLAAFDSLSAAQSNPVTLDIPGATATFYDLTFMATGLARTTDHGVAVGLTPNDTPIPDTKAAAIALLRLILGRI